MHADGTSPPVSGADPAGEARPASVGDSDGGAGRARQGRVKTGRNGPKSAAKVAARRAIERRPGGRVAVTQANPLALSRQEMGLLTKRLLVLALSDITRDDHDLEPIRITAWEYAQIFNIRGKSIYNRIEDSARELLEQTVQVKEPNGDWIMFQWVSEARYDSGRDSKDKLACIELVLAVATAVVPRLGHPLEHDPVAVRFLDLHRLLEELARRILDAVVDALPADVEDLGVLPGGDADRL
ncbi:MAG: replication initiation protein, partial [Vicinamibacterales bacterium]